MIASGELWSYVRGSLQVLAVGFVLSLVIGIPIGIGIARNRTMRFALDWYVDGLQTRRPFVALVPLITLIFGFDVTAKIIVVVFSAVFCRHRQHRAGACAMWTSGLLEVAPFVPHHRAPAVGRRGHPVGACHISPPGLRLAVGRGAGRDGGRRVLHVDHR